MPVLLTWVIIAIGVALLFTLTIFVHEFGHYWVARKLGLKVDGFSIGFGPKIFSWTDKDGVEWALRWLPIGGFVKLPQMITSEAIEGRSNPSVPPISPGKKIAVSIAGPAMNILFAFLIGTIVWWVGLPTAYNNTIIGYVPPGGVEARLGIREGDRIQAVNGQAVSNWEEIQRTAALSITSSLSVTLASRWPRRHLRDPDGILHHRPTEVPQARPQGSSRRSGSHERLPRRSVGPAQGG